MLPSTKFLLQALKCYLRSTGMIPLLFMTPGMKLFYVLLAFTVAIGLFIFQPQQAQSAEGCDPAYPTICLAPPPPDLDCKDIPDRNFKVLPPDPHKFDQDKDGIGCESKQ